MYCSKCGAELPPTGKFCPGCGTAVNPDNPQTERLQYNEPPIRPEPQVPPAFQPYTMPPQPQVPPVFQPYTMPPQPPMPEKKKSNKAWIVIAACVAALILCAVLFFLLYHEWTPATCTEPKTCTICGKTEGSAKGHDWKDATCTEPKICTVCGAEDGEALGHTWKDATCTEPKTCTVCGKKEGRASEHQWLEATYDTPKTCAVCGLTIGNVKGYSEYIDYEWSDGTVLLNNWNTQSVVLARNLVNCVSFCVNLELIEGTNYGTWYAYAKGENGDWKKIGSFEVTEGSNDYVITLSEPMTFSKLAFVPASTSGSDHSFYAEIKDVYERP